MVSDDQTRLTGTPTRPASSESEEDPIWYDRVPPDEPPGLLLSAGAVVIVGLVDAGIFAIEATRRFAAWLLEVDEPH
ncbi:hypothetical protein [Methylobacterium sp. R2-1]|uniref:hypothetical protein n=1 Tax=Methylobacterium sp. R2-1 TaxID=2587064 RepID=UPI0016195592|nr:hypothetical protein [Methylobacterium sp. R2-1]MBB2964918.1 hypothetical protein [Methylobacterium sp. R2-1]